MRIYRLSASISRQFWITSDGEPKTEADFQNELESGNDLFHWESAMAQMRSYLTNDDKIMRSELMKPEVWEGWKRNKAEQIYVKLVSDPALSSEEKDQITQEYHSSDLNSFLKSHIDKITLNGSEGAFVENDLDTAENNEGDPVLEMIQKFRWKRVSGNNIMTSQFTLTALNAIVKGLVAVYRDVIATSYHSLYFNIEVTDAGSIYYQVPFSEMVEAVRLSSPQHLNEYRQRINMGPANAPPVGVKNQI